MFLFERKYNYNFLNYKLFTLFFPILEILEFLRQKTERPRLHIAPGMLVESCRLARQHIGIFDGIDSRMEVGKYLVWREVCDIDHSTLLIFTHKGQQAVGSIVVYLDKRATQICRAKSREGVFQFAQTAILFGRLYQTLK